VCRDALLEQLTPDDLGRHTHHDVVTRIDAGDLFVESPRTARHAPRPRAEGFMNPSLTGFGRPGLVAVGIRHQGMVRRLVPP
jgi:hypothetical protein